MMGSVGRKSSTLPERATLLHVFLIADVRGYTAFTERAGDEAAAQLATLIEERATEAVVGHEGKVVEVRGDEVLAVFGSARCALHAALALQASCAAAVESNPALPLHVGVGLDAGEAVPVAGGYRGGALNLAARLCALAGPGEVLASETVIGLARRADGVAIVDRGSTKVKGMALPVHVLQVVPEDTIPTDVKPFTVEAASTSHIPAPSTPFIGRAREIESVTELLLRDDVRLVTLTGPGGVGKSRLAQEVAPHLTAEFPDGVYFVSLAPLRHPDLVPSAIASVLGVTATHGRPLLELLIEHLGSKNLLLVLDNFEHVIEACSVVSNLLDSCPRLSVVTTSRQVLRLRAEHEFDVPSLTLPEVGECVDEDTATRYEAVRLFTDRAQAVKPDFAVTNDTAPAIAEICIHLDGLPLAIELAAARSRLFSPNVLLGRLSNRLQLLTGGPRDLPERQQTLRATIDWSFALLTDVEKALLIRLSVFAGSCTLDAVEAVCDPGSDLDTLGAITSLVEKSLVRHTGDEELRFVMLETVREYAHETLDRLEESRFIRAAHAAYYIKLAEQIESESTRSDPTAGLDRLQRDHDNLRAALTWLLDSREPALALKLCFSLERFWRHLGLLNEGRISLEKALYKYQATDSLRALALSNAGGLTAALGDYDRATSLLEEGITLYAQLGDAGGLMRSSLKLAWMYVLRGNDEQALSLYQQSHDLSQKMGSKLGESESLHGLGTIALHALDYLQAANLLEQSLAIAREIDDQEMLSRALLMLGELARSQEQYDRAAKFYEESLRYSRTTGGKGDTFAALASLGAVVLVQGDIERSKVLHSENLIQEAQLGARRGISIELDNLAAVAVAAGDTTRAARLFGAADRLRTAIHLAPEALERRFISPFLDEARSRLGEARWHAAWEEGQAMTCEEAVAYALDHDNQSFRQLP